MRRALTIAFLSLLAVCITVTAADRPNVVLIISDDHAWTDYGFLGHEHVRTPNIDRLASEGLTFTRGYVTTAICSPSLATLLTGLYPHQHGITGNDPVKGLAREAWLERFFEHPMLPRLLADAGYLTLHTGKYWMRKPADAGFTDDMGETGRHGGRALAIGRETMEPVYRFIDKAKARNKPFFVWYAPFLPHTPHNPPERLLKKYQHVKDARTEKYYAMIEWLDETCGDLLGKLKEKGVDDNTLVLYLADNGWNEFGKAFPYENGVRTPVIARWPGIVKARRDRQHLAGNIDIVPTVLAACGVEVPESLPGINLLDERALAARKTLFFSNFAHDMVSPDEPEKSLWTRSCIHEHWKLIAWRENPPRHKPFNQGWRHKTGPAMLELFDLASDPHETANLAAEHPEVVKKLLAETDRWWTLPKPIVRPGTMSLDSPVTFPAKGALPREYAPDVKTERFPIEKDYFLFGSPQRSLKQVNTIQSEMPKGEFTQPPADWQHLARTRRTLREGGDLHILGLGDSIVNDTFRSGWIAKLAEAYRKAKVRGTVYVRGGGGCKHYAYEGRVQKYLVPQKPDLVFIGGISQGKDYHAIRGVIRQIRQDLPEVEILLATGTFGTIDPRRPDLLAKAPHSGSGDYGTGLKRIASELKCAYLDMTTPWAEYIRSSNLHPHLFYRDNVHANEYGEQILAKILMSFFTP